MSCQLDLDCSLPFPHAGKGSSSTILDRIGNTPMIRVRNWEKTCPGVEILVKAEWFNPGGSVKDRPALPVNASPIQVAALEIAMEIGQGLIAVIFPDAGWKHALERTALLAHR